MGYTIDTTNPALAHYIAHAEHHIESCCDIEDIELGESAKVFKELAISLPSGENMARSIVVNVTNICGQDFTIKLIFS